MYFLRSLIVGEPKSCIVQHPRGLRLEFCSLIVKIVLDMKSLYSNAARIAFCGKMDFVIRIGLVK